ncbi:MAG: FAD-dependent oxidoreductase [Deltaproteobacteria bacterium]|nr:FAD-dependent oxidoreductase [Deltaproteobacteria bacterium]
MSERFDVAIVGAGPGACIAAYALAKAGLSVVMFERGDAPGSKAMFGGVLYTPILARLFPDFHTSGCVERHVVEKRFALLSESNEVSAGFRFCDFEPPYFNHSFTALRARFDRWLASRAEEAGAMLITATVVDEVLRKEEQIVGVRARREGGEVYANVVIAADGANSLLAKQAGLRRELPLSVILGVKEVVSLPREVIEDRFNLEGDEGAAIEYIGGEAVKGLMGAAFIYTNKDTLSVGFGCPLHALKQSQQQPRELLNAFKQHPCVRRLLRGTSPEEYAAHLIPELGPQDLPRLVTGGMVVIGGAAGLVNANPIFHEGTNMAMASGLLAAEAIIEAHKRGDFSAHTLGRYEQRLRQSFAWQDMERYQRLTLMAEEHPRLFGSYPQQLAAMARKLMTVAATDADYQIPKRQLELDVLDHFLAEIGVFSFMRDVADFGRALL